MSPSTSPNLPLVHKSACSPQSMSSCSSQAHTGTKIWKISGQIDEPGQKDKLTFSSLAHQIEHGLNRGYPEIEIVDAVIRAISTGLQLCSCLEGKPNLTLPTLWCILHSHFQEKSTTELYKQLASEAKSSKETPQFPCTSFRFEAVCFPRGRIGA